MSLRHYKHITDRQTNYPTDGQCHVQSWVAPKKLSSGLGWVVATINRTTYVQTDVLADGATYKAVGHS